MRFAITGERVFVPSASRGWLAGTVLTCQGAFLDEHYVSLDVGGGAVYWAAELSKFGLGEAP